MVECLLRVSGEDRITIDRKHASQWIGTLPTRFLILTNELPQLHDAAGAMASRFIVLNLKHSFQGREDTTLSERLMDELPGILNWSIEGWKRLRERGHFVQPASAMEALRRLEDLGSPIRAFLRDWCVIHPNESVAAQTLFDMFQLYCRENDHARPSQITAFGRDLSTAVPGLRVTQPRVEATRPRVYYGVGLKGTQSSPAQLARMARDN